uniref:Uncharacterized protein n=1 Tax=Panagrellus redivivus TaxID=6233 RepID=A0A7E4V3I8_PANRE
MFKMLTRAFVIVFITLFVGFVDSDTRVADKFLRISGKITCNGLPVTNSTVVDDTVYVIEGPTLITNNVTVLANQTLSNVGTFDIMAGYFTFTADKRPYVQLTHRCGIANATCLGVFRYRARANFIMYDSIKPVDLAVGQGNHTTIVCN